MAGRGLTQRENAMHVGGKSRERDGVAHDKKNHIKKLLVPPFLFAAAMIGIDPACRLQQSCADHGTDRRLRHLAAES
jgi:hypothetical protein